MSDGSTPSDDARLSAAQAGWLRGLGRRAGHWQWLAMGLPLLAGILLLPQAWALARALHLIVIGRQPLSMVLPWLGMYIGLLVLRVLLAWAAELAGQQVAETLKQAVRQALFRQLLAAGVLWSRGRASGSLADVLGSRVELLDGYFARFLPAMVSAAVLPLVFAAVLLGFDWVAALLLFLTVPAIPLFMALVGWGAEAAGREHMAALSRMSGMFADRVRGLATLKLFGRASQEAERVARATTEVAERTMAVLRIAFLSSAVLEFFAALGVAGLAVYFGLSFLGLIDWRGEPLSLETALFCLLMAPEVYLPWRQLAMHYHDRANVRALVAEIARLFDGLPPVAPDPGAGREHGAGDGAAVMAAGPAGAGVPLPAAGTPVWQLAGLSLPVPGRTPVMLDGPCVITAGEWVALTGPSGTGKTTLLETLAGLRPFDGQIRLLGRPLADWSAAERGQRVLLISQRPWLVPGSIADNLRLACPQATGSQLREALRSVGLDAWLDGLPQGLDTPVGSRGLGLSGGQAQRLALARLFLSTAPVLLIDEPSAHLDDASRDRLLAQLSDFARQRTVLIATHDPAVVARAGRQWTIDRQGRIRS